MPKAKVVITCLRCRLPIFGNELQHLVRLQNGEMHATCHRQHWQQIEQMIAAALAAGTHETQNHGAPTNVRKF